MASLKDKPIVGDKFWVVDCGNAARYNGGDNREGMVTKVGRKFFTVEFPYSAELDCTHMVDCIFHIKNHLEKSEYSANKELYESKEVYLDEVNSEKGYKKIRGFFGHYGKPQLTLLQITEILEILNIQEET